MLTHLHIRNLAIIEELELEFATGMTVLTGETGAGKSILIDALGLILGDRGDTSIVRENQDKSEIIATFDILKNPDIGDFLSEQSLSFEDPGLIIRRIISKDGRSRAYINSSTVPVQLLRDLGEHLVNIHGQHAHQSLNKKTSQRQFLDSYAGHEEILNKLASICIEWNTNNKNLSSISTDSGSYKSTVELLEYQINELEALRLTEGEYDTLQEEYKHLSNISELTELSQKSLQMLGDDEMSAESLLQRTIADFKELEKSDPNIEKLTILLENTSIQLTDAVDEIRHYTNHIEPDPERLLELDKRLNLMMDMARKHQVHARELPNHHEKLISRVDDLKSNHDSINSLLAKQQSLLDEYKKIAKDLHKKRLKKAKTMSEDITGHLTGLGMPGGEFIIDVKAGDYEKPLTEGGDTVEFLVSLNPGNSPQPMSKIASGGELSRLSLAIQLVARQSRAFPTLIFDEVDAGIGGK
ncbi:MAG: DNA repair protein RecN, partial [Gammaproteobacteria bacterium]|nr:DNA repair protein RecN [Gammaproteobacteria bacterium]